ncbi:MULTISPECIES: signal recognition particle-docking protein FtsY [unclassified Cyanobium]|uniref:signal recognition particle-docking protein FtsY n=1 Tax=unclassified Cyanobium TaxID=2627006 RepID=UPI0020CD8386|nr:MULTISPECIES: signal recognition particle-docking protein FtsY [unclassified Cyanobium]MCP9857887.1 signal recognition particle-docking protein FtsY [Cyanobium sp. Cruz-8H5]MCP9865056.1 signal recognition particle-docking protein FtsY [Cyanobium sp. Cruz-8D1]
MVFDWFKRALAQPAPEPEPQPEPESAAAAPAEASVAPPEPVEEPVAAPTPAPAPAAPAGAGVDEDALAWARQAYARLKAQQEAASLVAGAEITPEPEPEPNPPTPESAPPTPEPEPPAAPPAGPGLSLLEQAAAQRQQRLQEITAPAEPAPAALPTAAATPAAAEADAADPSLGAFDATFTWSAEVLAAQGRRVEEVSLEEIDWLGRLRRGLEKTRKGFVTQLLENLGDDPLTPAVLDDLESTLLRADVGVKATDQVLEALRRRLNEEVVDPAEGLRFLKEQLRGLLDAPIRAGDTAVLAPQRDRLNVWLLVGVNGVGKTTTLGKLANLAVRSGYSCLIAAADTFRAAAVQQVSVWGERSGVAVVANPSANADPAAVVYDAIGAARSKGTELVLVDTAGRLQTKHNLMEELGKVRRTITKLAPEAVVESLLVLDASQGQNGLRQAMAFANAAGLTGVVLTKLDGSARGGVALAVASEAGLPIRFIGAGEGIRDLRPFNSFEFVEALLAS